MASPTAGTFLRGVDRAIYKYRTAAQARELLTTRVVWRPSPIEFNDPFDTRHFWRFGFELNDTVLEVVADRIARFMQHDGPLPEKMDEWLKQQVRAGRQLRAEGRLAEVPHVREQLKPAIPRFAAGLEALQREWKEELPRMRILCLSGACDNPRMWVQYADDHRGAAIGFRNIPGKNSALCGDMHPVTYQADPPALAETPEVLAAHITGEAPIGMRAALHRAVFTKGLRWEHEHEWRWWTIEDSAGAECRVRVEDEDFAAVYLGCRMKPDDQHAIVQIVRESLPHVQLYQARRSDTRFALDFVPLTVR